MGRLVRAYQPEYPERADEAVDSRSDAGGVWNLARGSVTAWGQAGGHATTKRGSKRWRAALWVASQTDRLDARASLFAEFPGIAPAI